jgi:hypothetical protein
LHLEEFVGVVALRELGRKRDLTAEVMSWRSTSTFRVLLSALADRTGDAVVEAAAKTASHKAMEAIFACSSGRPQRLRV